MSLVTIIEKPKPAVFQAMLFATIGQRGSIMEWVGDAGDEDVIFCHNPGSEGTPEDDESYILIAGEDLTTRLFMGQWLARYPSKEGYVYTAYDIEDFNALYEVTEEKGVTNE